jgi:hypothetical protein
MSKQTVTGNPRAATIVIEGGLALPKVTTVGVRPFRLMKVRNSDVSSKAVAAAPDSDWRCNHGGGLGRFGREAHVPNGDGQVG